MNILIIGGNGDSPLPNSVCIKNLVKVFISKGYNVWVLAGGDKYIKSAGNLEGAELWQIPADLYSRLTDYSIKHPSFIIRLVYQLVSVIRHLILLVFFPTTNPLRSRKLIKKAKKLVKQNNINLVLTTFVYYENIKAGLVIKKEYKDDIKVISYHLDLRTASANSNRIIRNFIRKRALHSIIKESRIVDRILVPYSGKSDIESINGIKQDQIEFVGFPVFVKPETCDICSLPFKGDEISISYVGSLSYENRNPLQFLSLLEKASEVLGQKIKVYFWGNLGGMESSVDKSPVASYQGIIENRFSHYIIHESDFLLNVGNRITYDMMPSKIFGMFATGKPIINLIFNPYDATIPYFEKYGHSINLSMFDETQDKVKILKEGLSSLFQSPLTDCSNSFNDYKPSVIGDIILSN